MSTTFYNGMADVVVNLLTRFGAAISIIEPSGEIFDPVTGPSGSSSPTTHTVNGVRKNYPSKMIDGERILVGDEMVVLCATDTSNAAFTPGADFKVELDGGSWKIEDIHKIQPAGVVLAWILQVRQ